MSDNNKPQSKDKGQTKSKPLNSYARFTGIGFQMIAIIAIGTFAGVKLDEKYPNEHNLYSLILSLTSVIMAIVFVIRRIIAASKNNNK